MKQLLAISTVCLSGVLLSTSFATTQFVNENQLKQHGLSNACIQQLKNAHLNTQCQSKLFQSTNVFPLQTLHSSDSIVVFKISGAQSCCTPESGGFCPCAACCPA